MLLRTFRLRLWAIGLATLACALVAPGRSEAGCADWQGHAVSGPLHLDQLAAAGALPDSQPLPVSPCAGLRCSGEPAPVVPVDRPTPPRAEQWAFTLVVETDTVAASHPLPASAWPVRPRHCGPAVFHPPR